MTSGAGRPLLGERGLAAAARAVVVSAKGAARWQAGHPWIYRTDIYDEPRERPGIVPVTDRRGRQLGQALYSPHSEIRLRLLTRGAERPAAGWWGPRSPPSAARGAAPSAPADSWVQPRGAGPPAPLGDLHHP